MWVRWRHGDEDQKTLHGATRGTLIVVCPGTTTATDGYVEVFTSPIPPVRLTRDSQGNAVVEHHVVVHVAVTPVLQRGEEDAQ